jgi:hypothetical protein
MSTSDRLIFGVCFGMLYPMLVMLMFGLLPDSGFTHMLVMAALLPAALLGDIFRLPPAGMHAPNGYALFAVVIAEGFLLGLALSFVVSTLRQSRN